MKQQHQKVPDRLLSQVIIVLFKYRDHSGAIRVCLAAPYRLAVLCKYILERYASSSKGRSLILDPGGPASTP